MEGDHIRRNSADGIDSNRSDSNGKAVDNGDKFDVDLSTDAYIASHGTHKGSYSMISLRVADERNLREVLMSLTSAATAVY